MRRWTERKTSHNNIKRSAEMEIPSKIEWLRLISDCTDKKKSNLTPLLKNLN